MPTQPRWQRLGPGTKPGTSRLRVHNWTEWATESGMACHIAGRHIAVKLSIARCQNVIPYHSIHVHKYRRLVLIPSVPCHISYKRNRFTIMSVRCWTNQHSLHTSRIWCDVSTNQTMAVVIYCSCSSKLWLICFRFSVEGFKYINGCCFLKHVMQLSTQVTPRLKIIMQVQKTFMQVRLNTIMQV